MDEYIKNRHGDNNINIEKSSTFLESKTGRSESPSKADTRKVEFLIIVCLFLRVLNGNNHHNKV